MKQYNIVAFEDIFHEIDFTKPVRIVWSRPHKVPQVFFTLEVTPKIDDEGDVEYMYWLCTWQCGHGTNGGNITFVRIALDKEEILRYNKGMEERMNAALTAVSI